MDTVKQAIAEAIKDPLATNLTASDKNAWNLADVLKAIASAVIAFIGMIPVVEVLQLAAGHPEQFGEKGPMISAGCVLLLQLIRTFRQGKPGADDDDHPSPGLDPKP